jgi:hypothetical protein
VEEKTPGLTDVREKIRPGALKIVMKLEIACGPGTSLKSPTLPMSPSRVRKSPVEPKVMPKFPAGKSPGAKETAYPTGLMFITTPAISISPEIVLACNEHVVNAIAKKEQKRMATIHLLTRIEMLQDSTGFFI